MSAATVESIAGAFISAPDCSSEGVTFSADVEVDEIARRAEGKARLVLVSLGHESGSCDSVDVDESDDALSNVRRAIVALRAVEAGLSGMLGTD